MPKEKKMLDHFLRSVEYCWLGNLNRISKWLNHNTYTLCTFKCTWLRGGKKIQLLPVWLSCDVLRLFRERPTMATIFAPMLERLFLLPPPTVPTAVSDWLPSFFSSVYMSPLMLVLLVMFFPEAPICLLCILDVKTLSASGWINSAKRVKRGRQKRTGFRWKVLGD